MSIAQPDSPTDAPASETARDPLPSETRAGREFVERLGLLFQADGLPRIAGRMVALLVLDGGPLAFGALAERLQVSRGSVSSNARLLEGVGILERTTRPGERADYFQLADDPYRRVMEGARQRSERAAALARATRESLADHPAAASRVGELERFHEAISRSLAAVGQYLDAPTDTAPTGDDR